MDLVIYPLLRADDGGVDADSAELLLRLYEPNLREHFLEVARSGDWVLLRRQ